MTISILLTTLYFEMYFSYFLGNFTSGEGGGSAHLDHSLNDGVPAALPCVSLSLARVTLYLNYLFM